MDAIGLHIVGGEACKLVQIDEIAMLFPCHFGYGFSFHPDSEYIAKSAKKYEEFLAKF